MPSLRLAAPLDIRAPSLDCMDWLQSPAIVCAHGGVYSLVGAGGRGVQARNDIAPYVPQTGIAVLRGGGQRTLPTQPWLLDNYAPEYDPAGNIWETKSWRERIKRHQEDKAARKWTEYDAYGPIHHVCSRYTHIAPV